MLLQNKVAVVYGAAGSIGSTVSRVFAQQGAVVYLAGRTLSSLQQLALQINNSGGKAIAAKVDATIEQSVENHLQQIIQEHYKIDISFNLIDINNQQDIPLTNMHTQQFVQPVTDTLHTQFITSTAAGKVMMQQKSGVILSLTATPGGVGYPGVGGFGAACAALESFSNQLAIELGVHSVRVVNIRSSGSPDSRPFAEAMKQDPDAMKQVLDKMKSDTMLKDLPLMNDIANIAVFLASDWASKITGVTIDATAGTTAGINYRTSTSS